MAFRGVCLFLFFLIIYYVVQLTSRGTLSPHSPLYGYELSSFSSPQIPIIVFYERDDRNAQSGIGVCEHTKNTFTELQRKKVHRYVVFKIDEKKKEVIVEKTGRPAETYDDFLASLPENDCRYAVYDYDFVNSDNCQKSKIFFIAWSPSVSRIRSKMLYATSKDMFRRELDGIHYEIQATDSSEVDLETLQDRAK